MVKNSSDFDGISGGVNKSMETSNHDTGVTLYEVLAFIFIILVCFVVFVILLHYADLLIFGGFLI